MFWLIDRCQNSVSADQYFLTVSRAQVLTHWVRLFFWNNPLTCCYFSNDRRLKIIFFKKCIWNTSCSWAALSNWPRTRKFNRLLHAHWTKKMDLLLHPGVNRYAKTTFAQIYSPVCTNLHRICAEQIWSKSMFSSSGREGNRFLLFSLSRVDHALRPIFMFRLVKIWQVSSYGKLMQRLETCLLSFVSSRDVLKSFFTCCTKWYTAAIKIVL